MRLFSNINVTTVSLLKFLKSNVPAHILFLLLFITLKTTFAAEVIYNRKIQDQLTHLFVSDIEKDTLGYMWFGTSRGLNRWDGYNIKKYLSNKKDTNSITSNKIQDLLLDKNNKIWVATTNGLNQFNPINEKFKHYVNDEFNSTSIPSNNVLCLENDKDGNIWIGTANGLCKLDIHTEQITRIEYLSLITEQGNYGSIRSLFCDSDNNIWIGFNYGGYLRILSTGEFEFVSQFYKDNVLTYIPTINKVIENNEGLIYLGTWGEKILVWDKEQSVLKPWIGNVNLQTKVVEDLVCDQYNNLWISDHLVSIHACKTNGELIETYSTGNKKSSIPSPHVSQISIFDNLIYVGTYNHGFFAIESANKPVVNLKTDLVNEENDGKIQTLSIAYIPPNQLFIGTAYNTSYLYNEDTREFKALPSDKEYIKTVCYDSTNHKVWIGSYDDNIISYNTVEEKYNNEFDIGIKSTQFVIETNDSLIILALWADGIRIYNEKTKTLFKPGQNAIENTLEIFDLCLDGEMLWICSEQNGFIGYNIKTNAFKFYNIDNLSKSIRPSSQFSLVKKLSNGKILVSSNEIGVCYFNKNTETFSPVGEEIGISDAHIKELIEDEQHNIWVITDKKAIKTDFNFSSYTELSSNDGLHFGTEHSAAVYSPHTKNIYLGSQSGLQYFSTDLLNKTEKGLSKAVITDLRIFEESLNINDRELNGQSISYTDSIILSRKQNLITIDFSSMNYNATSSSRYAYRLLGLNSSWNYSPISKNSITYSNLIPGKYTFEVKVSDNHGLWSENITKLHIIISPPFWQSGWFRFIIMIVVITIIVFFIKLREYNLIQDKKNLEAIVQERTAEVLDQKFQVELQKEELEKANDVKNKFFSIIAHDLRNPVGAIVQLANLLKENFKHFSTEQLEEIIGATSNSADTTMELLEDLLIWASSQTNKITYTFEFIKIYSIAESEIINLAHQAGNKNITIKNNLSHNIEAYADSSTIKTVIRNLLSNAIKFSHTKGTIEIGNNYFETYIEIYVQDNGIGIKPDKLKELFNIHKKTSTDGTSGEKGSGLGLSLCYEFIVKNKGKIWVESILGEGSTFYFTLPYR